MASHRGLLLALLIGSIGILGCSETPSLRTAGDIPPSPAGTSQELDFLGSVYSQGFTMSVGHLYPNDSVQPLGTKNDGFGSLTSVFPPGLESLVLPVLAPRDQHTGRLNRDTRIADFKNTGLPGIFSNTYDCVDPANPDDIARLYENNGDGTFTEVLNPFRDLNGNPITLQGRGETVVVADFNNDGFLDIFVPYYTYKSSDPDPEGPPGTICQNSPQSYLLLNDGTGHFTDVADAAGVSLRNLPVTVEGAQALDLNNDGLIDLCAGSHMFINTGIKNGIPHFVDMGPALGLPSLSVSEEGLKFIDAYNDGFLDLVLLDPNKGPSLYKLQGPKTLRSPADPFQPATAKFVKQPNAFPTDTYDNAFGLNAYDLNNDGLEDLVIVGGVNCDPKIFLNKGVGFQRVLPKPRPLTLDKSGDPLHQLCDGNGAVGFGDINHDGKIDIFYSAFDYVYTFTNNTESRNPTFSIELLGPNGEHNQQGRVVRMSPQSRPDVIYTRVVDGGSGYLSQNQYSLLIASQFSEKHLVTLTLPQVFNSNKLATVNFTISPGQQARVFAPSMANPNGRVELSPMRPFIFDPALYPAAQGVLE